jgi:peptidyl-prolyl cis-trans isomerase B (cyclophilin B)
MRDPSPRLRRATFATAAAAIALAGAVAADTGAQTPPAPTPTPNIADAPVADNEELVATIDVRAGSESFGTITVRLHDKYAPLHVKNFVKLAASGFYDGTTFHRTSPESFVQGGDPLSRDSDRSNDGAGGPGYDQPLEINDKSFTRGAVGAARMGARDNGSQFFICLKDHPEWDKNYSAIGHVIGGLEVADRIAKAERKGEHPVDDFVMTVKVEKRKKQVKLY